MLFVTLPCCRFITSFKHMAKSNASIANSRDVLNGNSILDFFDMFLDLFLDKLNLCDLRFRFDLSFTFVLSLMSLSLCLSLILDALCCSSFEFSMIIFYLTCSLPKESY